MKHWIAAALALSFTFPAMASSPCKAKRKVMHQTRDTLKACNKAWQDSLRPAAGEDPTDDCSATQAAFVAAVKDVKACQNAERPHSKTE